MLAKALQKEGLLKHAQTCYEYALTVAKNKGGIYKEMGYYYLTIGDKVRAEDAFRKSLEIRPYQPDVSAELGRMGVKVVAPEIVHQKARRDPRMLPMQNWKKKLSTKNNFRQILWRALKPAFFMPFTGVDT